MNLKKAFINILPGLYWSGRQMARYLSTETKTTSNTEAVIDMFPKGQRTYGNKSLNQPGWYSITVKFLYIYIMLPSMTLTWFRTKHFIVLPVVHADISMKQMIRSMSMIDKNPRSWLKLVPLLRFRTRSVNKFPKMPRIPTLLKDKDTFMFIKCDIKTTFACAFHKIRMINFHKSRNCCLKFFSFDNTAN